MHISHVTWKWNNLVRQSSEAVLPKRSESSSKYSSKGGQGFSLCSVGCLVSCFKNVLCRRSSKVKEERNYRTQS